MKKKLVLIDGHALAYRAHFALIRQGFTTKDGTPTWAIYGFTRMLMETIERLKPDLLAVAFDKGQPTFRHEAFAEYKAHRKPMPDGLADQIDKIRDVVRAFGVPIYELPGYEADDVIGTIARQAEKAGYQVNIVTGDRDSFQLVDEDISVMIPESGTGDFKCYGPEEVRAKMGLGPDQVVDYKALRGDPSDNIPGVPGIGDKTATKLLHDFHDFDHLYANLDQVEPPRIREKLRENEEIAKQSRFLARIDTEVPLDGENKLDWAHCSMTMPDLKNLTGLLEALEFSSIIKQLPKTLGHFHYGEALEVPAETEEKKLDLRLT
ncbi:MAG: 5'-3' exonuclease, partial [Bacteroidota bacterium]